MEGKTSQTWIEFYSAFAVKLLEYKNDRKKLIEKLHNVYQNIGMKMPKLEKTDTITDIDPFTVFGLFNKGISNENRIKIITEISKEFSISVAIPGDFDGIPVLNNYAATFYAFYGERDDKDIDHLWNVFAAALDYAKLKTEETKEEFIKEYDIVIKQKCVKWNITIGLFWCCPYEFLNLDSVNREILCSVVYMPEDYVQKLEGLVSLPNARNYLQICEDTRKVLQQQKYDYSNFPQLSCYAWEISKEEKDNAVLISNTTIFKCFIRLMDALKELGGTASLAQIRDQIIKIENLSKDEANTLNGKKTPDKFESQLEFARNYLTYSGFIDKEKQGFLTLTHKGMTVKMTEKLAKDIFLKGMMDNKSNRKNVGNAIGDNDIDTVHYWIYTPGHGAKKWDEFYKEGIMGIEWSEIGDLRAYTSKEEMRLKMKECCSYDLSYTKTAYAIWQFVHEMKVGDIIFAKKGQNIILGRGVVTSDYEYDEKRDDMYKNIRKIHWTHKGEWPHPGKAVTKTLTDITSYTEYVDKLNALFEEDRPECIDGKEIVYPAYSSKDFLEQVYMSQKSYDCLVELLEYKKNIILEGAPGVGKTFIAKRLAYSIMGMKNPERVMMVQFHQSYSYEDFIMGFRPSENGFVLKKGPFYSFCKKAEIDIDNSYFFIIDEINRGNLSKIFGELFMLIENDKRGAALQLLYSDEMFTVPKNVYIIGMMNTADRSLALLDYALRRRFAFFEVLPAFETEGFIKYQKSKNNKKFDKLINTVTQLNQEIEKDESLGRGFCIGHSYFCTEKEIDDMWLNAVVTYEIIPLLNEYWFDEPSKVKTWSSMLKEAIQ